MALRPFLASLFFARPFCQARFKAFRPISALRAAYGGCAPKRAFCEADVPEGARSDPSGLGAEMRPPERCEGCFAPAGATRALPWTCHPLKRAALNLRPFVTQWFSRALPGVLTAFCPKRKTASHYLARGVTTFRLLLHPTPGTTQASVQPLGAERRGGSACGR